MQDATMMMHLLILFLLLDASNSFSSLSTRQPLTRRRRRLQPASVGFYLTVSKVQRQNLGRNFRPVLLSLTPGDDASNSVSTGGGKESVSNDRMSGSAEDNKTGSDRSAMAAGIFGVTKAMVGTGLLALPGGLAAMSDYPSMLWMANGLMLAMGILSGYTFSLYGRLAFATSTKTLDGIWSAVFGKKEATSDSDSSTKRTSALPISISNFAYCYGCCLAFLLVIADSMTALSQLVWPGNTFWWSSRQSIILTVASTCLWPLCNMKSLRALAPVSIVGVLGCIVSTAFVVYRCPAIVKSSPYGAKDMAATLAQFSTYNRIKGPAPLILFSMGCVALMAHFSAPDFLDSFQPKNKDTSKGVDGTMDRRPIRQYNIMTVVAYVVVAIINAINLTCGFLTFGGKSAGIILNSYAASDRGAAISRVLTAVSVGGSFPILLAACRSSAFDLFRMPQENRKALTAILLSTITAFALVVKDAGFVVGFTGALMGTAILYIFPPLMFLRWTKGEKILIRRLERSFCRFLVGFGAVAALVGAATSVLNTYFPHLLI